MSAGKGHEDQYLSTSTNIHLQPDLQTAQKVEHGVTIKWGRASVMSAWSASTPPVSSSTSSATSASLSPSTSSSNAPHSPKHRFWTNVSSLRYLPWCLGTRCSQYVSRECTALKNTYEYYCIICISVLPEAEEFFINFFNLFQAIVIFK